jgi:phenylalanyl-tRNA synthetase alpha chain
MATLDELLAEVRQHEALFARLTAEFDALRGGDKVTRLGELKTKYAGRKSGIISGLMNRLSELPAADRREFGKQVNLLKTHVEAAIAEREAALAAARRPAGAVDITLSGRAPLLGYRHPLSLVRQQVQDIFMRLGYQVLEGPEVEDDYHNFEALNMPADHPARDMQDTLYLQTPLQGGQSPTSTPVPDLGGQSLDSGTVPAREGQSPASGTVPGRGDSPRTPQPLTLLRTHTSAMQIRHMEQHDPPVRLIAIGPVYRRDNLDLTHTPMFHQCEGLVVGPNITLADLKGTLLSMARALFGPDQDVRFRPSFFPYTEPSAEVDIRCIRCQGTGCAICKRTGWLEILGSGMVHPAVFEAVGYDPDRVTGFAFGMGIERVALLKWNVEDIRLFYENDMRFLEQFGLGPDGIEGQ